MRNLFLVLLIGISFLSPGQVFERTADNLLPVYEGKIQWADLDNDQDLDIIYSGFQQIADDYVTRVYENNNGVFTSRATGLPNIRNGVFALGDYDKDGDLDALLSGLSATGNISVLYQNDGAFSFSLKYSFPGLINSCISWADIDDDGDLDFLLAGVDDASAGTDPMHRVMLVYENTGATFNLLPDTHLPPCAQCAMAWADSNGDGKIDVLINGYGGSTGLYLNNGNNTFKEDENSILKELNNGDAKWGDFDNDGDMDALLSGVDAGGLIYSVVYENDGHALHERSDIHITGVGENWFGGTAWLDFDHDGKLDILVSGRSISVVVVARVFKLYHNNGSGQFSEIPETGLQGLSSPSVDFGDYDKDGDLDLCFQGNSDISLSTGIYRNLNPILNPDDPNGDPDDPNVDLPDPIFEMPDVFTPNGDDYNQRFVAAKLVNVKEIRIKIFNRWGRLVYQTQDLEKGWDGGSNSDGVYYWRADYEGVNGKNYSQKGFVSLLEGSLN